MDKKKTAIWFPAKRYGVGWGFPVTWQGWAVLLSYLFLVALGVIFLHVSRWPFAIVFFFIYIFALSMLLILICFKKGEAVGFRWGKKSR